MALEDTCELLGLKQINCSYTIQEKYKETVMFDKSPTVFECMTSFSLPQKNRVW